MEKMVYFSYTQKVYFLLRGRHALTLAAQSVHRMGLAPVAHMRGGYGAWVKADAPTEEKEAKLPKAK